MSDLATEADHKDADLSATDLDPTSEEPDVVLSDAAADLHADGEYDASQIQVLEGLEAVPALWACTSVRPVSAVCTHLV